MARQHRRRAMTHFGRKHPEPTSFRFDVINLVNIRDATSRDQSATSGKPNVVANAGSWNLITRSTP